MNRPNPAIVSEAGARPMPRWALLLVCAAYLLPGQFGRDAWRHADLAAFGFMSALAQGQASWWQPLLGGMSTPDGALLPYWLGAASIRLLPFLEPALAARLPFIAVLAMVLALVWYACFHLARTEAAQPVSFAFGGEAQTRDYARALADGAILALMASLGLLMLGHETTPELLQLLGVSLWLYALASSPFRGLRAQLLAAVALLVLGLSGAAQFALLMGAGGLLICQYSRLEGARQLRLGLLAGMAAVVLLASLLGLWRWRLGSPEPTSLLRLLLWFTWPTAALAAWTLWRWRGFLIRRHVAVPLTLALAGLLACVAMGGSDRALLLALPALAVLASFALPTLNRSLSAMVDWFSVFFFSALTLFVWFYFLALHTDWFPRASSSASRALSGESIGPLDPFALSLGLAGTLSWLLLVRWRTSRQRRALWRSLVLPAGGTVVLWLLAMTLFLAPLDLARSNRALLGQMRSLLPENADCVLLPERSLSLAATLQTAGWRVRGDSLEGSDDCEWALRTQPARTDVVIPAGWQLRASLLRPTERGTRYELLRRLPATP
ncbi:MAG: hypothetical protein ACK4F7_00405 [Inhella sp.]